MKDWTAPYVDFITNRQLCPTKGHAGAVYAIGLMNFDASGGDDWRALNIAIIERWSWRGLNDVKETAWATYRTLDGFLWRVPEEGWTDAVVDFIATDKPRRTHTELATLYGAALELDAAWCQRPEKTRGVSPVDFRRLDEAMAQRLSEKALGKVKRLGAALFEANERWKEFVA